MKSSLLRIFFEWALIASLLMSIGFFAWYWIASHGVRARESRIAAANEQFQRTQTVMQKLGEDCGAYAKTNADFARLFASLTQPQPPATTSERPKNAGSR